MADTTRRRPTAAQAAAARARRRERKSVPRGRAYVQSTFNNTIVTLTDPSGATIAWGSSGAAGIKGSRKSYPYAASQAADMAARKAMDQGMRQVDVFVALVFRGTQRTEAADGATVQRELGDERTGFRQADQD